MWDLARGLPLINRVQKSAAAQEVGHEEEQKQRTLVDGPAQGARGGGKAGAEMDAALVGEIDGDDKRQPEKQQQLFLAAGKAQLPVVAERLVPGVVQNTAEIRRRVGQAAGAEQRKRGNNQRKRARYAHQPRAAARDGLAPGQVVFQRLQDAVRKAPQQIGQPCAVPQAADKERSNDVSIAPGRAATAAAQRDVDVILQPAGQADVPAVPQFADGGGQKRLAEVLRQGQAEHLPCPEHDVSVAGEIGVKLERIQHRAKQQLAAVVGGGVGKCGVDGQRGAVGNGQLFKIAPKTPLCAALPLGGLRGVQLGHQLAVAVERPLREREEKRRKAQQAGKPGLRLHRAAADVDQVADQLQAEIPDAQHLQNGHVPDAQPQSQRGGAQFEQHQRGQRRRQTGVKPAGTGAQTQCSLPDEQRHQAEQQAAPPVQREIKHKAGREHQLPAVGWRREVPEARQDRDKYDKTEGADG